MTIKRYNVFVELNDIDGYGVGLTESIKGDFVKFEDHQKEVEKLQKEIELLRRFSVEQFI